MNLLWKATQTGILMTALVVGLSSCGKKQSLLYDQPEVARIGSYQLAWVEPKIIITDSLFTLIRSDRVDSFLVKSSRDLLANPDRSLIFEIDQLECFVQINLLDQRGRLLRPLVARKLSLGHYKFSLDIGHLRARVGISQSYFLKGTVCQESFIRKVL